MIIPDKKKMATMIVAELHGGAEVKVTADDGDSYEALASEIISAVKSGSAKALADALKAFVSECGMSDTEYTD